MENSLLRLCGPSDLICKMLEEILVYDSQQAKVVAAVGIIERAEYDLKKIVDIWKDPNEDQELLRLEEFSEEKLIYFCLKTMMIVN